MHRGGAAPCTRPVVSRYRRGIARPRRPPSSTSEERGRALQRGPRPSRLTGIRTQRGVPPLESYGDVYSNSHALSRKRRGWFLWREVVFSADDLTGLSAIGRLDRGRDSSLSGPV